MADGQSKPIQGRPAEVMPVSCHLMPWKQDFELALTETQALGYRACEPALRFVRPYASDPEGFRKRLAGHGLSISALYEAYCFTDDAADEATAVACYADVAKLVTMCGGDVVVIGPGMTRSRGLEPPTSTGLDAGVGDGRGGASLCGPRCQGLPASPPVERDRERDRGRGRHGRVRGSSPLPRHGTPTRCGGRPRRPRRALPRPIGHVHLKDLTVGGDLRADPDVHYLGGLLPFCELGRDRSTSRPSSSACAESTTRAGYSRARHVRHAV